MWWLRGCKGQLVTPQKQGALLLNERPHQSLRSGGTVTLTELPPTITVEQASELLGISLRSAYRAARTGELPTLRLGRRILVPTPKLLRMLGVEPQVDVATDEPVGATP